MSRETRRAGRRVPHSRSGCSTCRQRKVKCDEGRPWCAHCRRLRLFCAWSDRPSETGDITLDVSRVASPSSSFDLTPLMELDNISRDNWHRIMDFWTRRSVPILCTHDDEENPLRTLWFPVAMSEPSALYALLAQTATHRSQMLESAEDRRHALYFEARALETLSKQTSFAEANHAPSDLTAVNVPDSVIGTLTAILILAGARYLDRFEISGVGNFAQHVRGFWAVLHKSGVDLQRLEAIPPHTNLYQIVRIAYFFTASAMMEGIDLGVPLSWTVCETMLANAPRNLDYHTGYCHRYIPLLAEIVALENTTATAVTGPERQRMLAAVRTLTSRPIVDTDDRSGDRPSSESDDESDEERQHRAVEVIFKLSLAIRIHVSLLRTSKRSSVVTMLVQNAMADFQQNMRLENIDSFSLRALFEIGKACVDEKLRDFVRLKLASVRWRGYGTVDLYQRQLEQIWAQP